MKMINLSAQRNSGEKESYIHPKFLAFGRGFLVLYIADVQRV